MKVTNSVDLMTMQLQMKNELGHLIYLNTKNIWEFHINDGTSTMELSFIVANFDMDWVFHNAIHLHCLALRRHSSVCLGHK
jgi:hypothetical protein